MFNRSIIAIVLLFLSLVAFGCTRSLGTEGKKFEFQPGAIVVDKTTKQQVVEMLGKPYKDLYQGEHELYVYYFAAANVDLTKAYGTAALSAVPGVGLVTIFMDRGVSADDIKKETCQMRIMFDKNNIVRDYYYHDKKNMLGHDMSETKVLQAGQLTQAGKTKEARALLEEAISLNPRNHHALNNLAWILIDLQIDVKAGVKLAEDAVGIWPFSPHSQGTLGVGYMKLGDKVNAVDHLEKAVKYRKTYHPGDNKSLEKEISLLEQAKAMP